MLRIGGGRIAAPAPHSSAGRHHEPNAATFWSAIGCRWLQPARVVPAPTRGLFGHASVSLATPALLRPPQRRFVPVLSAIFGVHVAKESVARPKKPAQPRPLRPV